MSTRSDLVRLQDEWDAESEDEKPKPVAVVPPPKPKKSVKQAIAEREERERKEAAERAERKVTQWTWNMGSDFVGAGA